MEASLDSSSFSELSSFTAAARKEGFSFKPSSIVKDRQYCMDMLQTLTEKGSASLAGLALMLVKKYHVLEIEHAIS
jgi:hypothetical protein